MAHLRLPRSAKHNHAITLALTLGLVPFGLAGCKATPVTDAALTTSVQSALAADTAVAGQPIQVQVQSGVATIVGNVANDTQRTVAARDVAAVAGVKEVINNLSMAPIVVAPVSATASTAPPSAPTPVPAPKSNAYLRPQPQPQRQPQQLHQPAPIERREDHKQEIAVAPASSSQPQPQAAPVPTPTPPTPTFRSVTVAAGSTIPVRVTQTLDSATTQENSTFSGVIASDILVDGVVAIPAGSNVSGHVDAVHEAGHFNGSSLLTVSLTSINRRGSERLSAGSDPYTVEGKGRGKNTIEKTAGGAAVGAILGGIFGGGKGAAIGAAAGGGLGAGSQAVTRGQQVQIESESVVRFRLTSPLTFRVRTDGSDSRPSDSGLQPRP